MGLIIPQVIESIVTKDSIVEGGSHSNAASNAKNAAGDGGTAATLRPKQKKNSEIQGYGADSPLPT